MIFTHLVFDGLQFAQYSDYTLPVKYLSVRQIDPVPCKRSLNTTNMRNRHIIT